ncbi:MAG: preprotein translocase subunit SecY [Candidatus Syntrophonatronum acetioxidans]|uniref:Protein translocase subunit SecY n=1 Tax=Candidatus Syntrophonatronum acetioxidans TaxID=1795816 RepID=A0A424YH70_9FIRM|nr:MAG: preprotein translocase subunit SecY [Candidatus Syntrophonatronum acetioxidans]
MLDMIRGAWKVSELRGRIIFTLLMFVVFRLGSHIPVPGIDVAQLQEFFRGDDLFGFLNVIGGGALSNFTIFAMSITPYINASIIMQLLTVVIPKLEELSKEGDEGRKVINRYIRYGTVGLAFIQAIAMTFGLIRGAVINPTFLSYATIIIALTAGTAFLMWLGEQISEKGIGNGISLIIFAGIIASFPEGVVMLYERIRVGQANILAMIAIGIFMLALIIFIIALTQGERRVPVQYSKRVVGRKLYGGQTTHIPMKVNQAGVIPVIFASSILMFPPTLAQFVNHPVAVNIADLFAWGTPLNTLLYFMLIIFFTYFYTAIQFNPVDVAQNIKKYGGFIPGLRPGRPTAEFLERIVSRITFVGALSLAFISTLPILLQNVTDLNLIFSGTALIIVVGVSLETVKQIESHLLMRHYQGFMR